MSIISGGPPCKDRLGNDIYTDYRNFLKLEEIMSNADLSDGERWLNALYLFYGDFQDVAGEPEQLIDELVWFCSGGSNAENESGAKKLYNFDQDADFLYADFLAAYGIDLSQLPEEFHLHWWRFLALFRAMPEDAQMSRRIHYRSVDTSKLKGDVKREYERMKRAVALKNAKRSKPKTAAEANAEMQRWADEIYALAEKEEEENGI